MKNCKHGHTYSIVSFDCKEAKITACLECEVCKLREVLVCYKWDYKFKIAELWQAGKITTDNAKKLEIDICHGIFEERK